MGMIGGVLRCMPEKAYIAVKSPMVEIWTSKAILGRSQTEMRNTLLETGEEEIVKKWPSGLNLCVMKLNI